MPVPSWVVGQILTASDVDSWFVPLAAYKTADQSVTSSTTLVNDSELVVAVAASAVYFVRCYLNFEGGTAGSSDLKWGWTVPASATFRYTWAGWNNTGSVARAGDGQTATDTPSSATAGAGNLHGVMMTGTLAVAASAGNMQFKWAQNTSSATSTIVHAQSALVLDRIS